MMQPSRHKKRRPIMWRMTITNMFIVFVLVVFFTVSFVVVLFYEISSSKEHKLNAELQSLETKLSQVDDYSQEFFKSARLKGGFNYALYTKDKSLIYTSVSGLPSPLLEPMDAHITFLGENQKNEEGSKEYEYIIQSGKWVKDDSLYLYVFGDVTDDMEIIEKVPLIFIGTLVAGLLISFLAGQFMSRMMLRPIKQISSQMKAISANNLNERLPEIATNDELQELSHSFNLMIERLDKAFEKQKRFVSDASHELRTPLAVVQGHTAMLRRWGKEDRQTLDNSLSIIYDETRNMGELIDKLLVLARSENASTSMKKEKIEMGLFLKEITDEVKLVSPDARVELCFSADEVYADRQALKRVIRILLENSIKFCRPPGRITLKAILKDSGIQIIVADEGIGIEAEKLPFVFDRFYCADSSRAKTNSQRVLLDGESVKKGGTGLGLAIAKSIINSHQGTIDIESQLGKGTRVTIWLKDCTD